MLIDEKKSYGQVEVDIRTQNNEVCVTIIDNGIGLPKNINRLFEPYVSIKKEGTGLGLPIVKKIIEDVKKDGDREVRYYSKKFDNLFSPPVLNIRSGWPQWANTLF